VGAADVTRWFLALFFVGVATFYTVRILLLKRRTGTSPVFGGRPGTLHFAAHAAFRLFRVAILAVCIGRLVWPDLDRFLVPINALWQPAVLLLGVGLILAGFAFVVAVHFFMGRDWRSGTRDAEPTRLVTSGPFALSRNPMMLGVMAAQLGLFLALPSLFTLICLAIGLWAVVAQVAVEERLLRRKHGAAYDAYVARTPRWLSFR
jgi:protein-S-isoprenylcysteine O-methyltransferase Ste14